MRKSQLRQIIKEEIGKAILQENVDKTLKDFAKSLKTHLKKFNKINPEGDKWFDMSHQIPQIIDMLGQGIDQIEDSGMKNAVWGDKVKESDIKSINKQISNIEKYLDKSYKGGSGGASALASADMQLSILVNKLYQISNRRSRKK